MTEFRMLEIPKCSTRTGARSFLVDTLFFETFRLFEIIHCTLSTLTSFETQQGAHAAREGGGRKRRTRKKRRQRVHYSLGTLVQRKAPKANSFPGDSKAQHALPPLPPLRPRARGLATRVGRRDSFPVEPCAYVIAISDLLVCA